MNRIASSWQATMRIRAFKVLGFSMPTVILALIASSMLPGSGEKIILEKPWGQSVLVRGRIQLPERSASEVTTGWILEGPLPKPKAMVLNIRTKTLDDSFDTKKRWNFAPQATAEGTWRSAFYLKIPPGEIVAFRIRAEKDADIPAETKLLVVSDPERAVDKWLRMIEALIYPSAAIALVGIVMLLFSRFYQP